MYIAFSQYPVSVSMKRENKGKSAAIIIMPPEIAGQEMSAAKSNTMSTNGVCRMVYIVVYNYEKGQSLAIETSYREYEERWAGHPQSNSFIVLGGDKDPLGAYPEYSPYHICKTKKEFLSLLGGYAATN